VTTTLLKTKLYRPHVHPELVQRARLLKLLDDGLDRKLTVVSAPAGYGKTTLLSAWAATCECPVAWLSLDEGDNDPARFLAYLVAAVQAIEATFGVEILTLLQTPQSAKIDVLLPMLINQLDEIAGPFALALDDYHLVSSAEIHRSMAFLLDHQPQAMHVVIATRVDPPLPTTQLRARGQLTELRQADLRFTDEEARAFLRQRIGVEIAACDVAILIDRTEGWIAGLQLAALSMRGREDVSRFIAKFGDSHEYIVDYFASEILVRQPDSVKIFLMKTSLLEQLCGSLCNALTGQSEGQQTLELLREANLFVFPLDNERCWYRYHNLFGGLLRKQLQQELPEIIPELHRRASRWYEEHELADQAFEHALAASDQTAVARLADTYIDSLWSLGENHTILRWINALSEEQLRLRPELEIGLTLVLVEGGRIEETEARLRRIDRFLEDSIKSSAGESVPVYGGRSLEHLQGLAEVAHAWVASIRQDPRAVLEHSRRALDVLTKIGYRWDLPWLSSLYIALSNAHLQLNDQEAAIQDLSEAIELGKSYGNYYLVLTAMTKKAGALWAQGHINQAAQICQEGLRYIEQRGLGQLPVIDSLLITWGFILCEKGNLDQAEDFIKRGLELSRMANNIYVQAWGYQEMIRLLISKGDLQSAEKYLRLSDSLIGQHEIPAKFVTGTAGLKILILISQGKLAEAEHDLLMRGVILEGEIRYPNHFLYLCLTRLLLAKGNLSEAEMILDRLFQACQSSEQVVYLITVYKIRSLLCMARGEMPLAVESLEKALELAEPEGFIQTFLDEGRPMSRLFHEYIRRKGKSAFARRLLSAFQSGASPAPVAPAGRELVEPLSERESEVLAMLTEGLSNQVIAARLYLSLRTVKFHTSNIYGKLRVKTRTEAVSKARTLGLIS
jgi:LuxR family maltose regulon positive regulatory protein